MADTYRGLTIRIGGDTTELKNALKSANSDASNLGRVLLKTTKALRFDPSSIKAAQIRMEVLGDKTSALYRKLEVLDKQSKQLEISQSFKAAQRYVESTGDSVGKAKERLNGLNGALEKIKREFAKLDGAFDGIAPSKQQEAYTKWNKQLQESEDKLKHLRSLDQQRAAQYEKLVAAQERAQSQLKQTKEVENYRELQAEMAKVEAEAKKLANDYVNLKAKASVLNGSEFEELEAAEKKVKATTESLDSQLRKISDALDVNVRPLDLMEEKLKASETELQQVETRMRAIASMKGVDTQARNVHESFQKWKADLIESTTQLNAAKGKLGALSDEADKLKVSLRGMTSGSIAWSKLQSEISKTKTEISELEAKHKSVESSFTTAKAQKEYSELRTEAARLKVEIAETDNAMKNSSGLRSFATNATNIGLTLSTTVTPLVQQFLSTALSSAEEIDSAYRDMRKTVNGSEEDFEQLKEAAEEFSRTHVTSADQVLEIEAMGGQLGIAVEDLQAFAETVSNLNIATNITDAEEMSQKLGQLASITHMTSEEYDNFGDALVRLGNNEPALESDIMDISSRIGSMANICGMSVPDILALSTAVAATGQQSEAAGTAISNTMSDIEGAVASGGDKLEAFAKVAGVSAEEFASTWENSPIKAIQQFVQGLKNIDDANGSVDKSLEDLGITGVRQKQALEGLTQTVDVLNDSITMSENAWNGVSDDWGDAGDAAREAQKKAEGFSGQMSIMQNNVQVLGSTIGESLAPILGTVNGLFAAVTEAADGMTDSQKQVALGIAGIVTSAGPLLTAYGAIAPAVSKAKQQQVYMNAALEAFGKSELVTVPRTVKLGQAMQNQTKVAGKAGSALSTAGKAVSKFGSLSMLAKGGVLGLATIIGGLLVQAAVEAKEKHDKLVAATEGLEDAQADAMISAQNMASGLEDSAPKVEDYTGALKNVADASNNIIDAGASLADSLNETWSSYYDGEAKVSAYVDTIDNLTSKQKLTADEQEKLKLAVEGYNDKTGDSVKITNAAKGELSKTTEKIKQNAEAWRDNAKAQALQAAAQSTYQTLIEQQQELATARENLAKATKAYDDAYKANPTQDMTPYIEAINQAKGAYNSAQDAVNETNTTLEKYNSQLNEGEKSLLNYISTNSQWTEAIKGSGIDTQALATDLENLGLKQDDVANMSAEDMGAIINAYSKLAESGINVSDVSNSLSDLGIKQENLANLTPTQLAQLVSSYDGTTSSVLSVMQGFADQTGDKGLQAALNWYSGLDENSRKAVDSLADTTGLSLEELQAFADSTDAEGVKAIDMFAQALGDPENKSETEIQDLLAAVALKLKDGNVDEAAKMVGKDTVAGLKEGLGGDKSEATNAATSLGDGVIDFLNNALGVASPSWKAREAGEWTKQGLAEGLGGENEGITTAATSLGETVINGITGALQTGQEIITGGVDTVMGWIQSATSSGADNTAAGAKVSSTMASGIGKGAASVVKKATSTAKSAAASAKKNSSASAAGKNLNSTFQSAIKVSAGDTKAGSMGGSAAGKAKTAANGNTAGKHLGTTFGGGISPSAGVSKAKSMADNAKAAARVSARPSGSFLGQGFVQGIGDWAQSAINAATSLAQKAINAIKKTGKQGSPWKTTIEAGKFAAQGLAVGIRRDTDLAVDAAAEMAERTYKAASASGMASDLVSSVGRATNGAAFTNESTVNNYYQVGSVTFPEGSEKGQTVEEFVKMVIAYKGAM